MPKDTELYALSRGALKNNKLLHLSIEKQENRFIGDLHRVLYVDVFLKNLIVKLVLDEFEAVFVFVPFTGVCVGGEGYVFLFRPATRIVIPHRRMLIRENAPRRRPCSLLWAHDSGRLQIVPSTATEHG